MTLKGLLSFFVLTIFLNLIYAQTYISETIQYDGETREYEIYVPAIYDSATAVPLIFSFHGGSGTISDQIAIADFSPFADTANFIAIYPQALPDLNDGGSTNWIHKDPTSVDDVFFIDALIDSISSNYQIDANRIYACGYSLGGEFTLSLGCKLNNRIAAIAVVARTMQTYTYNNCSPVHPTGVMTILGTADGISDYNGVWFGGIQYYVSADQMHKFWAIDNNCDTMAGTIDIPDINSSDGSTVERNTWSTTTGCNYVEELKVIGGGHDWPGSFGNMDIDATQEIWQFVSRYDLNGLIGCTSNSINYDNRSQEDFTVYPNPVGASLEIDIGSAEEKEYRLYNPIGELVLSGVLNSQKSIIEISSLAPNVYILNIDNQSIKLIKTK